MAQKQMPSTRSQYIDSAYSRQRTDYPQRPNMTNSVKVKPRYSEAPVKISEWLVAFIPIINIFCILAWAFGSKVATSKKNFAYATIIVFIVVLNIAAIALLLAIFVFKMDITALLNQ